MITGVAADYRSFIKVDEVDGRSPVERAAATFCTRAGRPVLRRDRVIQDYTA
jgi:hypothetical protein